MKRTRIFAIVVLTILAALVLVFRWRTLAYYRPDPSIAFAAPFRTMAEHDAYMADKEWPYILEIGEDRPALLYYGSWHTNDPHDPQLAQMEALWNDFKPTVAVTENRLGFFVGTRDMGVSAFGEFGFLYAIARASGVPVYSLEPSWEAEVGEVKAQFPVEEVTLFYTLRVFLNERSSVAEDGVDDLAAHLLRKRGSRPGLEGSLPDLRALDALWDERFADLGPWRTLPPEAIHPSTHPGRLHEIANLVNEVRDRHAARVILDLMAHGERVFAVAGGSHVVKQESVLRAGMY